MVRRGCRDGASGFKGAPGPSSAASFFDDKSLMQVPPRPLLQRVECTPSFLGWSGSWCACEAFELEWVPRVWASGTIVSHVDSYKEGCGAGRLGLEPFSKGHPPATY